MEDYGLPQDAIEILKLDEKRANRIAKLAWLLVYLLAATGVAYCLLSMDNQASIWSAIGCALLNGIWIYPVVVEIFLSTVLEKIIHSIKAKSEIYQAYCDYLDDLHAYWYWEELTNLRYWHSLDGHQFEDAVATVFRRAGFVAAVSKHGGDGGVDIILEKDNARIAVQCKACQASIGPSVARDFYGTMLHFGFEKGIIVSRSGFTKGVYEFVQNKPITVMDLDGILRIDSKRLQLAGKANRQTAVGIHTHYTASIIKKVEHKDGNMYLVLANGGEYVYYNFPLSVFCEFMNADSLDVYFYERIEKEYPYYQR